MIIITFLSSWIAYLMIKQKTVLSVRLRYDPDLIINSLVVLIILAAISQIIMIPLKVADKYSRINEPFQIVSKLLSAFLACVAAIAIFIGDAGIPLAELLYLIFMPLIYFKLLAKYIYYIRNGYNFFLLMGVFVFQEICGVIKACIFVLGFIFALVLTILQIAYLVFNLLLFIATLGIIADGCIDFDYDDIILLYFWHTFWKKD